MTKNGANKRKKQAASAPGTSKKPTVVGIGASAGGLGALKRLFELIPADSGLVFVVVVHLSPEHKSHLADLLQPNVKFPVQQVSKTVSLEPNNVYVIPPNANLSAIDTHLRLSKLEESRRERAPIDHFFRTLASTHDGHSIGLILTGTGSDGTLGLREIKAKGGVILVQDPNEAEFDGMPQSAIATGLVDRVLPLAEIPDVLMRLAKIEPRLAIAADAENPAVLERVLLPKVLAVLKARTERDFSRYKAATLLRRIARRMQLNYIDDFDQYLEKLREQPDEVRALADDLLITVTSFFRDAEVFKKLEEEAVPHLFDGKQASDTVRVWSVGCATGEEAYSLAMILLEEAARREAPPKVQIFASDLHKRSLDSAREGLYPGDIQTDVTPERLKRFFQQENGGYRICKEVRDIVVFAPHNLLGDPPFSRLDLIACRNLLIYLERAVQRDVIELFHYALCPDGYLLLGSAETVDASELFRTEDKKLCMYRKRNVPAPEPRLPVFPLIRSRIPAEAAPRSEYAVANVPYQALHHDLLERFAPPSILVSPDNKLVHLSEHAGKYLVHPGGETTLSVIRLVREELRIELQGLLQSARGAKEMLDSRAISVRFNGHAAPVVMHVRPAQGKDQDGFVLVIFEESESKSADDSSDRVPSDPGTDLGQAARRIDELEVEINTGRQRLQATIEEYETSREEMRASQEEMQSTNEELRSTMEELETSKEELQSINEELQTVNQENRHKVEELSQLSSDIQNLLTSTEIATLFLDRELRIMRFTPRLADLFNIRVADRGRPILDLTHRLGYTELREDAQTVLERLVPIEREIQDEAKRWYLTRVLPYRSTEDRIEGVVITFVEITDRKKAEEALHESEALRRVALAGGRMGTWRWNLDSQLIWGDVDFWRIWGTTPSDDPRPLSFFNERMSAESRAQVGAVVTAAIEKGEEFDGPLEVVTGTTAGHWLQWRGRAGNDDKSTLYGVTFDITEQKLAAEALRKSEERQAFLLKLSDALRPLSDPVEIQTAAMHSLGQHLGVMRAGYYTFDADEDTFWLTARWEQDASPLPDRMSIADFGHEIGEGYRAGRTMVLRDAEKELSSPEDIAAHRALNVGAWVAVPLVKGGRLHTVVGVHSRTARDWTRTEIELIEELAERTWAAVERARAEKALGESEGKYRALFASVDEGFCIADRIPGKQIDFRYSAANPAFTQQSGLVDPVGHSMRELVPEVEEDTMTRYAHVSETGISQSFTTFGLAKEFHVEALATEHQGQIAVLFRDVTKERQAERVLRESEERQAFMLKLSDAANSAVGAIAIQQAAMKLLTEHLSLSRAFYFRVERDDDGWAHVIDSEYTCVPGLPSMVGRHSLKHFGTPLFEQLAQGIPLLVDDVAALPGISPRELASYQAVGVTAFVNVPLRRNGEYSAGITAHDVAPRTWKPAEIELMRDAGDRVWAAVERARAEKALQESEERLRQFGEASQDVLWIRDAETLQWTYLTPAFETIYGLNREAALRGDNMTGWLELIVPEDREPASASLKRVRDGEWVTFEFRIRRPADGTIRWLRNTDFPIKDATGKVTRIGGIGHDITEIKETEEALAAAEIRQRALLEGIPQLVWRAADSGEWTWASTQWTEYTGQSDADSQVRGWLEPLHPEDREGALSHWSTAMETGGFEVDYRIRHAATENYRWFHTRATPVRDAAGAIVEWLGTSTDIEDMKQAEADREQAAAFTRTALAEKEELLKEVHHRVKNNLQVITSLLNLQADQIADKQTLVAFDEARNRVASIASIHELLYRSSSLAAIHLADYARELAPRLLDFYGMQTRVMIEVDGDGAKLELERAVPYGLLLNELLSNALKHAFPGEGHGKLRISFEEKHQSVIVRVDDDGIGLPAGFDVERTSSLGLKLVQRLAHQLRGTVKFRSGEAGTSVEVQFPITTT